METSPRAHSLTVPLVLGPYGTSCPRAVHLNTPGSRGPLDPETSPRPSSTTTAVWTWDGGGGDHRMKRSMSVPREVPPKRPWRAAGTAREAQASMVSTKNESEDPDEFRYIEEARLLLGRSTVWTCLLPLELHLCSMRSGRLEL
eukprot:g198.t1